MKLKPDWDRLERDFKGSPVSLIGSVDCTNKESEQLCARFDVQGYPFFMWGRDGNLQIHEEGGNSYHQMKTWADENLGGSCGPGEQLPYCSDADKKSYQAYSQKSTAELEDKIQRIENVYESELKTLRMVASWKKYNEDNAGPSTSSGNPRQEL
mmetsp:Transcript_15349/g.30205  ORF Transcript_15349/g.30205 Transcript_15349/m.30205 type:complete len:154 (+) Transcript_15349:137-598(+)